MNRTTIIRLVSVVGTAVAAEFLTFAAVAHADPGGSNCTQFGFNGPFVVDGYPASMTDAQWHVSFYSMGTAPSGPAVLTFNNGDTINGHVVEGGVVDGRNVHFRIQWNDKSDNFWDFTGAVNDYARVNGSESLPGGGMSAQWHSASLLDCLASKPQGGQTDPASLPYGPDTCEQGFVWREASPADHVCVTPPVRDSTAQQNSLAAQNREPGGGAYGPDTCKQGFVWRDAFAGDHVCVLPPIRNDAAADNAAAPGRLAAT